MGGEEAPAGVGVDPRPRVADVRGEVVPLEPPGQPSPEPRHAGVADDERGQLLLGDLGQPLPARTLQLQIVLFGVEPSVRPGEDEPVVDELVERARVGSELGRLQPAVGRPKRLREEPFTSRGLLTSAVSRKTPGLAFFVLRAVSCALPLLSLRSSC